MNRTRSIVAVVAAFCVTAGLSAQRTATPVQQDQAAPVQKVSSASELRPTTQEGVLRAEFFDEPGRPLLRSGNVVRLDGPPMVVPPGPPGSPPVDPAIVRMNYLRNRVCSSDLVVYAAPRTARAYLNKSETFLFTDYTLDVQRSFRPAALTSPVIVSHLGGRVYLGNRLLQVDVRVELPIGVPMVLIGTRIPGTAGFRTSAPIAEVKGNALVFADFVPVEVTSFFLDLAPLLSALEETARACPP